MINCNACLNQQAQQIAIIGMSLRKLHQSIERKDFANARIYAELIQKEWKKQHDFYHEVVEQNTKSKTLTYDRQAENDTPARCGICGREHEGPCG